MQRTLSFLVAAALAACFAVGGAYAAPSETLLAVLPQPVTHSNVEVIDLQYFFPAGTLQPGDEIHIDASGLQPGTHDHSDLRVRLGTTGTTADFNLNRWITPGFINAGQETGGTQVVFKILTYTTAIRAGGVGGQGSYVWSPAGQPFGAYTIPDIRSNDLYLSIGAASAGATDQVTMQTCKVRYIKP